MKTTVNRLVTTTSKVPVKRNSQVTLRINGNEVRNVVGDDGKDYLVAPVVAIKEGVLNGEKVTGEVIENSTPHWDKVPVTVNHPQVNGEFVGVGDPGVTNQVIGFLANPSYSGNALHGEIWIDVKLANSIGGEASEIVERLQNGFPMDVSTGYLAEVMMMSGEFHGEHFQGEQTHIFPDHLAVLPNITGACSWGDGCGTPRTNHPAANSQAVREGRVNSMNIREIFRMLGDKLGYSVASKRNVGDLQFLCQHCSEEHTLAFREYRGLGEFDLVAECPKTQDLVCATQFIRVNGGQLGKMLDTMVKDQKSTDVNRAGLITSMAKFAGTTVDKVKQVLSGDVTFVPRRWLSGFAQALDVDLFTLYDAYDDDTASYQDENFENTNAFSFFSKKDMNLENATECGCGVDKTNKNSVNDVCEDSSNKQETTNMLCPKVKAAVTDLIANESTRFTETDREFLESLELTRLELFAPVEVSTESGDVTETVNADAVTKPEGDTTVNPVVDASANKEVPTPKDLLVAVDDETQVSDHTIAALLSGISNVEHRNTLTEAYKFHSEARNNCISKIIANSTFSEAELKGKPLSELRKINELIVAKPSGVDTIAPKDDTNFGLANGSRTNVDESGTIPIVPILLATPQSK